MFSNMLQVLVVMYFNFFCPGASFRCFPDQKEITEPVRGSVEITCYLYGDLHHGYQLILEKNDTSIGQCFPGSCLSSQPYHLQLSTDETKMVIFRIDNLEPDNAGAYYLSLKYNLDVIFNMFNRVLVLNLTVMAQEAKCGMTFRINSSEIESSCRAKFPNHRETSLHLTVMDINDTEINVNSSMNISSSSWQSYSTGNLEKFVMSLDDFMTRLIVPKKCVLITSNMSRESHSCHYPLLVEESQIDCGYPALEVWLISIIENHFKTLKLFSKKPTIIDANLNDGNNFIVICGVETGGLIDIRNITKVLVMENDTCYTVSVTETTMQTTFNIVPGCVSTTTFHSSTTASNTPTLSLGVEDKDYAHFQTEIATTTSQRNNEDYPSSKGASADTGREGDAYLQYAMPLWIVSSITVLLTITTCLFIIRQRMRVNDGKNLQLQYYHYDRRGNLASDRRDDQVASLTAEMTSRLINTLARSELDFSQVPSVNDGGGSQGEVSRALIHRPALPPTGYPEASYREADGHRIGLHAEVLEKANAFALVASKCHQVECYPTSGLRSEKKLCSATDEAQDSGSIYQTVNDAHLDVYQGALATNFSHVTKQVSFPGNYTDLREENNEIDEMVQPVKQDGQADNHSHGFEGKFTLVDLDLADSVEELYAKPNKKVKSTSLLSNGCLECVVEGSSGKNPAPLESSHYAELRQSPSGKS